MLGKAAGASVGVSRQFQKVIWNHQGNLLATIEKDGNGSTKQICLFDFNYQTLTFVERPPIQISFYGTANVHFSNDGKYIVINAYFASKKPLVFNIESIQNAFQVALDPDRPDPDYQVEYVTLSSDSRYLIYNVYGNSSPVEPRVFVYEYDEATDKFKRIASMDNILRSYGSLITRDAKFIVSSTDQTAIFKNNFDGSFTETMRNSNSDTSVVQICHELQNGLIVLECDSQLATFQITENGLIENKRVQPVASGSGRLLSYALDNTAISFDYSNVLHKTIFSLESITTIEIGTLAHIDYFSPPSLNPTHSSLFAIPALDQNLFSLYSIAGNQLQKINPIIQQYEGP